MSSALEAGASDFQLYVNEAELDKVVKKQITQDKAHITHTYLPGATCEELIARCDPCAANRQFMWILRGHDEFSGFADEIGLFGQNPRSKVRQSDLNYVIDKGTPAKAFRDDTKG